MIIPYVAKFSSPKTGIGSKPKIFKTKAKAPYFGL